MSFFERFIPVFTRDQRYVSESHQKDKIGLRGFPVGTSFTVVNSMKDFLSRDVHLTVAPQDPLDFVNGERGSKNTCVLPKSVFRHLPEERRSFQNISDRGPDFFLDSSRASSLCDALISALSARDWRKIPKNPFRRTDNIDHALEISMLADLRGTGLSVPARPTRWLSPLFPPDYYRHSDGKIDSNRLVSKDHLEYVALLQRAIKRLLSRVLV